MTKPKLKVVKNPITKPYVQELVARYMSMTKDKLLQTAKRDDLPVLDFSICNILVKCIPTGDFSKLNEFMDETISKIEQDPVSTSPALIDEEPPQDMDFGALKSDLVRGVFVSTKLMANQATHEYNRVGKLRGTIERIEERLFHPDMIRKLPEQTLAKVYNSASTNLNNSINYIKGVNTNLTQQLDVISQIQNMQAPAIVDDANVNNPAMARIRELIARKIREKSGTIEADASAG
jgi:hypothetical protein